VPAKKKMGEASRPPIVVLCASYFIPDYTQPRSFIASATRWIETM